MSTKALEHLAGELESLARQGRLRARSRAGKSSGLSFCSNDYLGYARSNVERPGAGAARLIAGSHVEHDALEDRLARWLGVDDALLFTSGYAANVGLISALASEGDVVISDALNHASIIDGCRLSRARVIVVPHLDAQAVERELVAQSSAKRKWVVTESYFSMDGDVPDLGRLRALCDAHGAALLVDEAHALGVFGSSGRGLASDSAIVPDALVGTFGKALGGAGAFVAGSSELIAWLWNRARSFVFSTALSPRVAHENLRSLDRAIADDASRARVLSLGNRLRSALAEAGYDVPRTSVGPIIPVLIGGEEETVRVARALASRGIEVVAIRPPTVPKGTSRLRVTVHAGITDAELDRAIAAFADVRREVA